MSPYLIALIVITTTLAVAAAAIYFGGYADDILEWYAEKYYKAKAKAEFVALQNTGSEKAQDFLKSKSYASRGCYDSMMNLSR